MTDAAHVPGGYADGIAFPRDADEAAALVSASNVVLPVGAQSSLTGGATPRGGLVLSTRALTGISPPRNGEVRAGAGVPLQALQSALAASGLYYPPVPTFDGAFVGGTIATNAAGAATFKYGTTRDWVVGITVVLPNGSILEARRREVTASDSGRLEIVSPEGSVTKVAIPTYEMPRVPKLSAGYFAEPGMDLVDLFIGSEGTLGIVADATLRVIPLPRVCVALVSCDSDAQALAATAMLRDAARDGRSGQTPLHVAAVEYMDSRSLQQVDDPVFARAGIPRAAPGQSFLIVQIEMAGDDTAPLERLSEIVSAAGIREDPLVAPPGDVSAAERLFQVREAVPASVNARIGMRRQAVPGLQKTAGDMIVPFDRLADSLALYRRVFERRGLDYAIWGHVSDGNLHPNVLPASLEDVRQGNDAIREIAREVIAMGGAPLAEHGVGRSPLKQELLRELYGENGIEMMRTVKRALDPAWKLAPGVLFSEAIRAGG